MRHLERMHKSLIDRVIEQVKQKHPDASLEGVEDKVGRCWLWRVINVGGQTELCADDEKAWWAALRRS